MVESEKPEGKCLDRFNYVQMQTNTVLESKVTMQESQSLVQAAQTRTFALRAKLKRKIRLLKK